MLACASRNVFLISRAPMRSKPARVGAHSLDAIQRHLFVLEVAGRLSIQDDEVERAAFNCARALSCLAPPKLMGLPRAIRQPINGERQNDHSKPPAVMAAVGNAHPAGL
jgi:hypothetical protein